MEDFSEQIAEMKAFFAKYEERGYDGWIGFNQITSINWNYFKALEKAFPDYEFGVINYSIFQMRKKQPLSISTKNWIKKA